ncbi:hypothetical protein ACNKHV_00945 [Shigella flexneri]
MLNGIRDKGLSVPNWTAASGTANACVLPLCAAKWLPEYDRPAVDMVCRRRWKCGLCCPHMTGVHSLRGLKSLDIYQALRGLLDWGMQQRLDSELPCITVPTEAGLPFVIMKITRPRWR